MFTGIVERTGTVIAIEHHEGGARLRIDAGAWPTPVSAGESISVNGCCLTVAKAPGGAELDFDVVHVTLERTALGRLAPGVVVNLERSATPTTFLGGHIVLGHVDGVGTVVEIRSDEREHRIRVRPPEELVQLIVERGSIAMDGVSLTVAGIGPTERPRWFEVALIPTTLRLTTLSMLAVGDTVNLEADCLVRAVAHWLRLQRG